MIATNLFLDADSDIEWPSVYDLISITKEEHIILDKAFDIVAAKDAAHHVEPQERTRRLRSRYNDS